MELVLVQILIMLRGQWTVSNLDYPTDGSMYDLLVSVPCMALQRNTTNTSVE